MSPDINSLASLSLSSPAATRDAAGPPRLSNTTTTADTFRNSPPSPRSPSLSSLQAAAAINAGLQRTPSNANAASASPVRSGQGGGLERRRSSLMNNFSINDPALPAPGEMQQGQSPSQNHSNSNSPRLGRRTIAYGTADPHHQRQPSLGEIHQELENEQEAQVNRLLHMIRIQQDQIAQIQRQQAQGASQEPSPSSAEQTQTQFPTPPSSLSTTNATNATTMTTGEQPSPRSSGIPPHNYTPFNRPHSLSRQSSTRLSNAGSNSRSGSPGLRPHSGSLGPLTEDFLLGGTRDESAFYQAETQMLTRENQMLKLRIRELERQIADMSGSSAQSSEGAASTSGQIPSPTARTAHSPARNSPLAGAPATFSGEVVPSVTAEVDPAAKGE